MVPLSLRSLAHPPTASTWQQAMPTCLPSLRWQRCLGRGSRVQDMVVPCEVSLHPFSNLRYKSYHPSKSVECSHNSKPLRQLIEEEMITLWQLQAACFALTCHQVEHLTEAVAGQTRSRTHRPAAPSSQTQLSMIQLSLITHRNRLDLLAINASINRWIQQH